MNDRSHRYIPQKTCSPYSYKNQKNMGQKYKTLMHTTLHKFHFTSSYSSSYIFYDNEGWTLRGQQEKKMRVAKMRILKWMWGHTRKDRIQNDCKQKYW